MLKTRKGNSYLRYEDLRDLGKGKVTGRRMEDLSTWMVSGDAFVPVSPPGELPPVWPYAVGKPASNAPATIIEL